MIDATQEGTAVAIGDRLVIDFGVHNTEMAYRLHQDLTNFSTITITIDGKPL